MILKPILTPKFGTINKKYGVLSTTIRMYFHTEVLRGGKKLKIDENSLKKQQKSWGPRAPGPLGPDFCSFFNEFSSIKIFSTLKYK